MNVQDELNHSLIARLSHIFKPQKRNQIHVLNVYIQVLFIQ